MRALKIHYFNALSGFTLCGRVTSLRTQGTFAVRKVTCTQCREKYRRQMRGGRRKG